MAALIGNARAATLVEVIPLVFCRENVQEDWHTPLFHGYITSGFYITGEHHMYHQLA